MRFEEHGLGTYLIYFDRHLDDRGSFTETYRSSLCLGEGISCIFVQDNLVYNESVGTFRGFHYQVDFPQAKYITVISGSTQTVVVDPCGGEFVSFELYPGIGLYVPSGLAHGYLTLEDGVILNYKVSSYYSIEGERILSYRHPGIKWKRSIDHISSKDSSAPVWGE